jgi:hypothetical protein
MGANKSLVTQDLYGAGIPATATTPAISAFDQEKQQFNYRIIISGIANPSAIRFRYS